MTPRLTVVIPTRDQPTEAWRAGNVTMRTLLQQTFQDFYAFAVWDGAGEGAAVTRNKGFSRVTTELVLFSDDDVSWRPDALEALVRTLDSHPEASYSYGAYLSNWRDPQKIHTIGAVEFDRDLLRHRNFISTMAAIRSADFPGFDPSLRRYQDWELWLRMLAAGKTGVYCGCIIFETRLAPNGITFGSIPIAQARAEIVRKHGL